MQYLKTFTYNQEIDKELNKYQYASNWPVVYLLENTNEIYVGESTSVVNRAKQHWEKPERRRMKHMHVISDEEYNISAAKDIESLLIEYIAGDASRKLQNKNNGMRKHNYFDKEKYVAKFEKIWEELLEREFVKSSLNDIRNRDVFKLSPYKSLTDDQMSVVLWLREQIVRKQKSTTIVEGGPGTGKTVLAIYLYKYLKEHEETKNLEIGLVIPMTGLRKTVRNVFAKIDGLKRSDVLGPNDVTKKDYDLLIVDEAHRLKRRKNLTGYGSFDATNKKLGLDKHTGTELDWIMMSARHKIFFYDERQSVRPSDVDDEVFKNIQADRLKLTSQLRVEGGAEYIEAITDFWNNDDIQFWKNNSGYELTLYEDISKFRRDIKFKHKEYGLSLIVSGYSDKWVSRKSDEPDIVIGDESFVWNSTAEDWPNSKNATNEVGCIHTIQGYDLNYVGVIIGKEIDYDPETEQFTIDLDQYHDVKGKSGTSPEEVKQYILNIYKTLMTRGIKGTYVYVRNKDLREYMTKTLFT